MNGGGGGRRTETETHRDGDRDRQRAGRDGDRQTDERTRERGAFGQPYILFMIFGLSKQLVFSD